MKIKTIFFTILIIFCVSQVYPVIFVNYWCQNLAGGCPAYNSQPGTTQEIFEGYQVNLDHLQIQAAAKFYLATASWNRFLAKIEMAEVSEVNYKELNNLIKITILRIEEAESIFAIIAEASKEYQGNSIVQEKLKNFDYKFYCAKHNLNPAVMAEVECYFSTGDIIGLPNRVKEQLTEIKIRLEGFKQSIERQDPSIDEMYGINQNMLTMALYGQYTAMVFREVRLE